jgi:hypothetical protein
LEAAGFEDVKSEYPEPVGKVKMSLGLNALRLVGNRCVLSTHGEDEVTGTVIIEFPGSERSEGHGQRSVNTQPLELFIAVKPGSGAVMRKPLQEFPFITVYVHYID